MWAKVGQEGSALPLGMRRIGERWGTVDSFLGSYEHQLDLKSRLVLPRPFKRVIGTKEKDGEISPHVILARGFNGCLYGFSEESWPRFERTLREADVSDEESRAFAREMADHLCVVPVDTVGRIVIPNSHLEIGGLRKGKEVKILGMTWFFEVWDLEKYRSYKKATTTKDSYEARASKLFKKE